MQDLFTQEVQPAVLKRLADHPQQLVLHRIAIEFRSMGFNNIRVKQSLLGFPWAMVGGTIGSALASALAVAGNPLVVIEGAPALAKYWEAFTPSLFVLGVVSLICCGATLVGALRKMVKVSIYVDGDWSEPHNNTQIYGFWIPSESTDAPRTTLDRWSRQPENFKAFTEALLHTLRDHKVKQARLRMKQEKKIQIATKQEEHLAAQKAQAKAEARKLLQQMNGGPASVSPEEVPEGSGGLSVVSGAEDGGLSLAPRIKA